MSTLLLRLHDRLTPAYTLDLEVTDGGDLKFVVDADDGPNLVKFWLTDDDRWALIEALGGR